MSTTAHCVLKLSEIIRLNVYWPQSPLHSAIRFCKLCVLQYSLASNQIVGSVLSYKY
jgi:hypothetical protein